MKIYLYCAETNDRTTAECGTAVKGMLERAGAAVVTKQQSMQEAFPDVHELVERRGRSFLEFVDAIVIEGSSEDSEIGYILAFAIGQNKPTLLLLRKHTVVRNPLTTFGQKIPRNVRVVYYDIVSLEKRLLAFCATLGSFQYQEVPTIKFTLRITPQIEKYLEWKTHNTKNTKADFLRKIILDELIAKDEEYQRTQRKKRMPASR